LRGILARDTNLTPASSFASLGWMGKLPTACVVGAGSSGIAAVKALKDRGVEFDCFEKSDRIGGNWVYGNRNGMSSAYRSLHINSSRDRTQFADFPMPQSLPDFPHHTQVRAYFDDYVDHFGLRELITFETAVEHAAPDGDGWRVRLDSGEERRYDALLVANGHHWDARWPEPPFEGSDRFAGRQMHGHDYKDPGLFLDERVVVLGMGNSAMDIAVDASHSAAATYLAARRGAWIIPKYVFGRPLDQYPAALRVPWAVRQRLAESMLRVAVGAPERYGLPKPDHRFLDAHPTISDEILSRISHGAVVPKPNIARLTERTVVFADGSEVEADIVVYCTGYKVTFPFFDPGLIAAPDNDLPLFRRVFHPDVRNVFFIGLLQPIGATMPLAEAQARWVGDYLAGRYELPSPAEMRADIDAERARMFKRYVKSKRHTMQVDFDEYLHELGRERRRGAR
jgi:dimethylaniline monooxygenase (N-oxide forming)